MRELHSAPLRQGKAGVLRRKARHTSRHRPAGRQLVAPSAHAFLTTQVRRRTRVVHLHLFVSLLMRALLPTCG